MSDNYNDGLVLKGRGYWANGEWIPERVPYQPCAAAACAQQIREQQNLPPGTPVPVMIVCTCPKCRRLTL